MLNVRLHEVLCVYSLWSHDYISLWKYVHIRWEVMAGFKFVIYVVSEIYIPNLISCHDMKPEPVSFVGIIAILCDVIGI